MSRNPRRPPLVLSALPSRVSRGLLAWAVLVVASALVSAPPLWDAATGDRVVFAHLARPVSYLVAAPLFGVWDMLSLLTLSQHYAVLLTLIVSYTLLRACAPKGERSLWIRAGLEAVRAVCALVGLFAFYAAGMLIPRPMVALEVTDPDLVAIDFHSHTNHSHDGWSLFTARRNRAWHEAGGFDVAYITDHYTWAGVDDAQRDNPQRVGDRTALLSGAEIRIYGRPTNILGDRARYQFALDTDSVYMEPDSLVAGFGRGGPPPTLLYTMPGGLEFVVPFTQDQPSGVIAIELNDGSPRGLEQVKRERRQILALADSLDLAVIAAANLHGWGRTVAAWSLMEVPGWQEMTPKEVGKAIEVTLHQRRRGAVSVIERRVLYHDGSAVLKVLTLPWLGWEHFRMLSVAERASWLLWLGLMGAFRAHRSGRFRRRLGALPTG